MVREYQSYADRPDARRGYEGADPDNPVPGHYRHKLRSGGVPVGVRIWWGQPHDPLTGEIMDRSYRMQAEVNGSYVEIDRVWPACAGSPIAEAEYEHLCSVQAWAQQNAPDSPLADPRRKVDALSSPILF